ncbi:MAG: hypothetical protein JW874_08905 [Spirochaetales bacterium]|nr:hypothetical protein [Spirochaetales bacterium]
MKKNAILLLVVLVLSAFPVCAEELSKDLKTLLSTLTEASPPVVLDDYVLFSYFSSEPVYLVGAAFEHESFRQIHSFMQNKFNVFVLLLPKPENTEKITYRLVVDGLWIHDPQNVNITRDSSGLRYSVISIPLIKRSVTESPSIEKNRVSFTYSGSSGKTVYLSGDFNNWNPYLYPMTETSPGIYSLTLSLPSGTYFYCFYENGEKKLDRLNSNFALNRDNQEANFFSLP